MRTRRASRFGSSFELTEQIRRCDHRIKELVDGQYAETRLRRQVKGVAALTALIHVLTLDDSDAGAFFNYCT